MIRRLKSSPSALNAGASLFAFGSTSLWGLLSISVAVHYLDKSEIGLWAVVNALLSYLLWMDLGIGLAIGRLITDAIVNDDREEIDKWWTVTRVTLWIQCIIVIIVGLLLVSVVIRWMGIEPELMSDASYLLYGGVFITALSLPMRGVTGLLTAQNRLHWILLTQAIVPWCNLIIFFLFLRAGWGLKSYLFGLAASQVTTWVCYCSLVFLGPYRPKWNFSGISKNRFQSLFKLSGNMAVVGLVGALLKGLPTLMLARLGGLAVVPVYNFSSRAPYLGGTLLGRTYQSFYPSLQRLYVSGNKEGFRKKHLAVGRVTLSLGACGAALVLVMNPMIVGIIAADHYFAGLMVNMWFAVSLITIPFAGLFQILLPISGSMGKAAPIAVAKLLISIYLAILGWNWFGLAGIAAVFALLPLVDLCYAWLRGVKECGYSYREISPQLLTYGVLVIVLTIVTGAYIASIDQSSTTLSLFSLRLEFPTQRGLLAAAGLFFIGFTSLVHSFRRLIKTRKLDTVY